ncbi:tyrosine-protein kinase ITK/TSK isoform X1 [Gouania willdenowi]|uniref:Tyrosine-protein kinase n=1 Tax=Gouania willdenowi TaxID=441366 RepID=A0A8C5E6U0_GOUWI|nr:tyrosine-protein kinase ITK/TSK isoform X1 [Gouania willdenowi]
MFPRVILNGTLIKKSQQKKKISPCNYKERFFVLDTQDLKYSERRLGKKPTLKGSIQLSTIKCVEAVITDVPIPCNYKYPFQVFYDNYYLYIFAPDNDCRQTWIKALKEETKQNNLVTKFHPNFWINGKWECCQQKQKLATGCRVYDPVDFASKKPLPQTPESKQMEFPYGGHQTVIALQDYTPQEDDHLPLQKHHEYVLINSCSSDCWTIQDDKGNVGLVPCTYITEKYGKNFERFMWYNKNMTRGKAEDLLMKEGKEGGFMVRDSSQAGFYTVSVFTRAPGPNMEKNPRVKHYQIRQTETKPASFYLADKYLFNTIPELILYHQHNAAGLITRLRHPITPNGAYSQEVSHSPQDQWEEIKPEELTLGQELGSGQFGVVVEGKWREKKVAVKMMKEGFISEEDFKDEAKVTMKLFHCKLVQLYGVCTQRSPICLVFEFMHNGCLSDYLKTRRGRLSPNVMLGMCLDVCEGMAYLESSNFIHRDLAARNCLVSKNNEVKVSDFGMTRFVFDDQYTSSQCSKFPVKWSPPEVLRYSKFSSKSDVWSFGVVMWEVYNEGRFPYENRTNAEVMDSLNAGQRLLMPRLAPKSVHLLMEECWEEKPEDRPTFAVLLHELASLSDL